MAMKERPEVTVNSDGGKSFEHEFEQFYLKAYVPANHLDGQVNNYTFHAPLLLVFEENRQSMAEAIDFATKSGLADIAASYDASVLFIYPTAQGGWAEATASLYADVIAQVRMNPVYEDGIVALTDFFTHEFKGYFIKGAIFRADIYSFGASADYVARNLLQTLQGEYLWGPGEITPAMCSMQNLSVALKPERDDIAIISVDNSAEVNEAFKECKYLLKKSEPDYVADFHSFVWRFKRWCGIMQEEPNFAAMNMTEEAGSVMVKTAAYHMGAYQNTTEHKVGYFAYYNNHAFDNGPIPLLIGFHGGGDSALFYTFVPEWYRVAHKYGFLFVAIENHQNVMAQEAISVIEHLKEKYNIDEHRIYAGGFSMGSGKTWDLFHEFPQVFAGMIPACALFPVKNNPFSPDLGDRMNRTVPVPLFYSGGEASPLPELPCHTDTALERVQYLAEVNQLQAKFDLDFDDREHWSNPIWGEPGNRVEKLYDESRDSYLTIHYYDSEDGICRTALASVSGQQHELRHHSCENAWKFISKFTR